VGAKYDTVVLARGRRNKEFVNWRRKPTSDDGFANPAEVNGPSVDARVARVFGLLKKKKKQE
jgi:hypothetical protein